MLFELFLDEYRQRFGKPVHGMEEPATRLVQQYSWPGNVRELKNTVEFAVLRAKSNLIGPADLPPELIESAQQPVIFSSDPGLERQRILDAIRTVGGNRKAAAEYLGISRATLYRRLHSLNIVFDPARTID